MRRSPSPRISAVISTFNRADLLARTLEGLVCQTLPQMEYEVVIVDDGSTDETRATACGFMARLPLKYAYQRNAGLASARNHGLYLSQAPLLLFLDDDDIPDSKMLEQHVRTHQKYSDDRFAVLGHTRLDASLADDPVMHFATEVGCFLFSYPFFRDGDVLNYEHFWGGRTSCKRAFLLEHGVFNPVFRFGCEDIELAYRLSKHGLRVVYNANAVTTMVRGIDFDGFCNRLIRQGRSNYVFSRLHSDQEVQRWTEVANPWVSSESTYNITAQSARQLDRAARLKQTFGFELDNNETALLHRAYMTAFRAAKQKGIRDARLEAVGVTESHPAHPNASLATKRQSSAGRMDLVSQSANRSDAASNETTRLQHELEARDATIQLLREQAVRHQQVIDAQHLSLLEAQSRIGDMGRSLTVRVADLVREIWRRLGR